MVSAQEQNVVEISLPITERRKKHFLRFLWSWFLDVELDTLEKQNINYKILLIGAILYFGSSFIAVPPPLVQSHFLVLPVGVWALLLAISIFLQIRGRKMQNFCSRAHGAMMGFLVCGGLIGPLMLSSSSAFILYEAFLSLMEVILWVRLSRECRGANKNQTVSN